MVTRTGAQLLMALALDLEYIKERASAVNTPNQYTRVKGKDFILDTLRRISGTLDWLVPQVPALSVTLSEVQGWASYFDKKYSDFGLFNAVLLDSNDAKRLLDDSSGWISILIQTYGEPGTALIRPENMDRLFPESLVSKLDSATKADLNDGMLAILHLIPTPAAMILLRVAENVVRTYYARIAGKPAGKKDWNEILEELRARQDASRPLIGYLDYIRDKRNEVMHPETRYTQEEAERILLQVKGLVEEVFGPV